MRKNPTYLNHPNVLGAGAKKRRCLPPKIKFKAVMQEFERGTLHSGSGKIVKNQKQAVAIAFSESQTPCNRRKGKTK